MSPLRPTRSRWRTPLLIIAFCFPGAGVAIALTEYNHSQDEKRAAERQAADKRNKAQQEQISRTNGCKLLDNFDASYGGALRQLLSESIRSQEAILDSPASTAEQKVQARKLIKSRTETLNHLFPLAEISKCPPPK